MQMTMTKNCLKLPLQDVKKHSMYYESLLLLLERFLKDGEAHSTHYYPSSTTDGQVIDPQNAK